MRHHAGEQRAEPGCDVEQRRILRVHAAAPFPGVDLDQAARRSGMAGNRTRHGDVIGDYQHRSTGGVQLRHLVQLLGRDANGVENV